MQEWAGVVRICQDPKWKPNLLFSTIPYIIFFPIVFALYWLAPARFRRVLLLIASYVFYMSWIPSYALLIAGLTAVNYALAFGLDRWREKSQPIFAVGILFNLGTLIFFKYTNFLISSLLGALGFLRMPIATSSTSFEMHIILPLGISFFAFEFIHYLTDVYKGGKPISNVVDFSLFAAFFPSQIAGPIKRYQDFAAQLQKPIVFSTTNFTKGIELFLQGLFKKVAIADNVAVLANLGFTRIGELGTVDAWIAVLAFTIQIYFDFSGYTDMGRGSAYMLGYALPDNFNFPYLATSLQDFWKRWHISLSSWLRDYVYIPLGGNRKGASGKYKNLLLTMLIGGLWHGAAWHFVIWGGIHGSGLILNHWYSNQVEKLSWLKDLHSTKVMNVLCGALTLAFVMAAWVFFRADTADSALRMLAQLAQPRASHLLVDALATSTALTAVTAYAIYACIVCLPKFAEAVPWSNSTEQFSSNLCLPARAVGYVAIALAVIGFAPTQPSPFIYFQF